jgi:leucyl-tRNA synthetase
MAPFITEEIWRNVLRNEGSIHTAEWPTHEEDLAKEEHVTLVVQVDGKVRDTLDVAPELSEEEAEKLARESENARRAIGDREVVRVIARPPKLVNFVTR